MDFIKEILEKNGVGAEVISEVETKIKESGFIPKSRFDQINDTKKELEKTLEDRDKQLEELSVKVKGNDDLTKTIEDLKELNSKTSQDYENKISKQTLNFAIERELAKSNVRNPKAVRALLDMESVKMDGSQLIGLSGQIEELKKSDDYLFQGEPGQPKDTGNGGNFGRNKPAEKTITKDEFKKMGYKDRVELYNTNKELYDALK